MTRSSLTRCAATAAVAVGVSVGALFGSAPAALADTPPILGGSVLASFGGCLLADPSAIVNCAQQELLTQHASLMLDVNPVGTTIVVLGAGLYADGTMRPVLVDRLVATLRLAERYPLSPIITSGGVPRSGVTESQAMREWLIAHNVAPDRITEENSSRSTVENARNTAVLLAERRAQGAVVVSSPDHVDRALRDFRKAVAGKFPVSGVASGE